MDDLVELLSLHNEQGYYVGIIEAVLSQESMSSYDSKIQHYAQMICDNSKKILVLEKKDKIFGTASDKDKILAFKIFYCFYHLTHRFNDESTYDKIIAALNKFQDNDLQILREFTKIIQPYETLLSDSKASNILTHVKQSPDNFIQGLIQLVPQLKRIIKMYDQPYKSRERSNLAHLISEIMECKGSNEVKDCFSGELILKPITIFGDTTSQSTTSSSAHQSKPHQKHPPFQPESLKDWSTECLLEILSSMEEQAYWVTLVNSIVLNIPDNQLDERIQLDRTRIKKVVEDMLTAGELNGIKSASEDQKRIGFHLYRCIHHITDNKSKLSELNRILCKYPEISLINTLRQLVKLSADEHYLDSPFIESYDKLRTTVFTLIEEYNNAIKQVHEMAAALRAELRSRVIAEHGCAMRDIISGAPIFCFTIADNKAGIPELQCTNALSFIADPERNTTRTIPYEAAIADQPIQDLTKMSPAHLNELASLLHEQSKCIALFETFFKKSPVVHADEELNTLFTNLLATSAKTLALRRLADPQYAKEGNPKDSAGLGFYNAFCSLFAIRTTSHQLATSLAQFPIPELATLKKLVRYFDLLTIILGKMELGKDVTRETETNKKLLLELEPAVQKMIEHHDSMFCRLKQLYADILDQLKQKKSSQGRTKMRCSIFTNLFLPQIYSARNPIIIETPVAPQPTAAPALAQTTELQPENQQKERSEIMQLPVVKTRAPRKHKLTPQAAEQPQPAPCETLEIPDDFHDIYKLQEMFMSWKASTPVANDERT